MVHWSKSLSIESLEEGRCSSYKTKSEGKGREGKGREGKGREKDGGRKEDDRKKKGRKEGS